ncbi:MAG: GNAT family N-acetyltransferase [Theionarchaea archaeon]|nr:GNAT family N-acetyltransferase [Theionarchaea archaeon]
MYQGSKVALKPLERKHLPKCVEWFNDPDITENLSFFEPIGLEGEQRWYEAMVKDAAVKVYAIETIEGEYIGNVGFHDIDLHNRKAELGIFIGEQTLWDRGLGTETINLALNMAFKGLNLNKVYVKTFSRNKRAQTCFEKVHFIKEGILREDFFKNGEYIDCIVYSILAREYFTDENQ